MDEDSIAKALIAEANARNAEKPKKPWTRVRAAERWQAEEGDMIEGVYTKRVNRSGPFGEYATFYIRRDDGHVLTITGSLGSATTALFEEIAKFREVRVVCTKATTFIDPHTAEERRAYEYELYVR
jgi:hypothetical protein